MRKAIGKVFTLALMTAALTTSSPGQALSNDQLLELAIDMINPDLQPFRPAILCTINGGALDKCATGNVKAELEKNEDYQRIRQVYDLASQKKYPALVSQFGVTAVCATFSGVPGTEIICNEFGQKLAAAGQYAIEKTGEVVGPAGKAALAWIGKTAGKFGCAIGFYCPKETNPNKYIVEFSSAGPYELEKFDLATIWKQDYAPRVSEGIQARLTDPHHYKLMLMPSDSHDDRFMLPEQLGSATINQLSGATTIGPVWLYKFAFAPFQKELNQRYAAIVNERAAGLVEEDAVRFAKLRDNWMQLRLPIQSEKQFDSALLPLARHFAFKQAVAECVRNVEDPNFSLFRWAENGVAVGDTTLIDGQGPAVWAKGKGWCQAVYAPALAKENESRRKDFDQALAMGCTRRPNGTKGLVCPGIKPGVVMSVAGPMSYCQRAYKNSAKTYCSAIAVDAPPTAPSAIPAPAPVRPRLRVPGVVPSPAPAPEPTPSPSPTLTPLRPKILTPGT